MKYIQDVYFIRISWGQCWQSQYVCSPCLCLKQILMDGFLADERASRLPGYTVLMMCINGMLIGQLPMTLHSCVSLSAVTVIDSGYNTKEVSFLAWRACWNAIQSASNNSKNGGRCIICLVAFLDKHANPDPTAPQHRHNYLYSHSSWLVPQPLGVHIKQCQQLSQRSYHVAHKKPDQCL